MCECAKKAIEELTKKGVLSPEEAKKMIDKLAKA